MNSLFYCQYNVSKMLKTLHHYFIKNPLYAIVLSDDLREIEINIVKIQCMHARKIPKINKNI